MTPTMFFCAIAYMKYLNFVGQFANPAIYAQDYESLAYLSEDAADRADDLRYCPGREAETREMEVLSRQYAEMGHQKGAAR
jgi:hypothetical protein